MEANRIQELVFSFMDLMGIPRSEELENVWMAKIPEK